MNILQFIGLCISCYNMLIELRILTFSLVLHVKEKILKTNKDFEADYIISYLDNIWNTYSCLGVQ